MSSSRIGVVAFVTGLHLLAFTPNPVDCVSVEIKDDQKEFTFQAGRMSEIEFNIVNGTCRCESSLYLYKKTISGKSNNCKLILRENCIKHSGDCNCAAAVVDSRHGYKMWRTFHLQDSGDWVFEVWNDVLKTISIRVEGTFNGSTKESLFSDDNFSVLRSKEFILFSLSFNVVSTITIAVVVTLIVRRQRKFSRSRQNKDLGDEHLYANDITLNAELQSHTAGGQTIGDYLNPVLRPNVYVTSYGKETALDTTTTLQPKVTGRRQNSTCEEQCEYIGLALELAPPPPPPPLVREDHQLTALTGEALLPPPPPPPLLPLLPKHSQNNLAK